MNRRPKLELIAPNATPEEAAAVVAALEQFMRATTPVLVTPEPEPSPWQVAALWDGVGGAEWRPAPWQ